MSERFRSPLPVGAVLTILGLASIAYAQEPPVIEEEVEVREVGVVADLPAALRGRSAAELGERLMILEQGVARQPVSVGSVSGAGDAYARVLLLFDRERCSEEILRTAAAALGAAADRLVALGPVEVADLGAELERRGEAGRSSEELASTLAEIARGVCGAPPGPERLAGVTLRAEELVCPQAPCLLVWVGPGWGGAPEGGVARPASTAELEPLARALAGGGWLFVAAPIVPTDPAATRPTIRDAESRPGSDRHTFGINVLQRSSSKAPLSADEYSRFVDVWLSPLRRLVAATAGEYVDRPEELEARLAELSDRSVLWYRTDRKRGAEPPALEVRDPGENGRRYRVPEWAPELGK